MTDNTQSKKLLMPKAIAVWLIENTSLTFLQIAKFCNLHLLEVEALANEEQNKSLKGIDPTLSGETSRDAIAMAEKNPDSDLEYFENVNYLDYLEKNKKSGAKQSKYKRQNKPEAILWILQQYNQLSDYQVAKLLKSTATTVKSIRLKTYWNYKNLHPKNPVIIGLCTEEDIAKATKHLTPNI